MRPHVASFLALASEEMGASKSLLHSFPRQSANLIHEAAEKLLKAVLCAEEIPFPKTHQLGELAQLLPEEHPWRADLASFDRHGAAATLRRYPTPGGALAKIPSVNTMAQDIADLERLLPQIENWCRRRG
jgi:HEPN domain-containing protein